MDENDITAEWARNTSKGILIEEKIKREISECLNVIKTAVENNRMAANFYGKIENLTNEALRKRGFTTKINNNQGESYYIKISW